MWGKGKGDMQTNCPLRACSQPATKLRSHCPTSKASNGLLTQTNSHILMTFLGLLQVPSMPATPLLSSPTTLPAAYSAPASLAFLPPQGLCTGSSLPPIFGDWLKGHRPGRPFPAILFKIGISLLLGPDPKFPLL